MKQSEVWFLEKRATSLAYLLLTEREDLEVIEVPDRPGMDFLVRIQENGQPTRREFGVAAKGKVRTDDLDQTGPSASQVTSTANEYLLAHHLPMCIFLFYVDTSQGFYRWLSQPVVRSEGQQELLVDRDTHFKPLDYDALNRIVAQVNRWYGASTQDDMRRQAK